MLRDAGPDSTQFLCRTPRCGHEETGQGMDAQGPELAPALVGAGQSQFGRTPSGYKRLDHRAGKPRVHRGLRAGSGLSGRCWGWAGGGGGGCREAGKAHTGSSGKVGKYMRTRSAGAMGCPTLGTR